jgi:glycosyltransferase involved in cell wall biosynthesis
MTASLSDAGKWPNTASRARRAATALRDTALGYWRWLEAEVDSARRSRPSVRPAARHALIVVASLPPRFGSGVFRPHSWLRHAEENGWRVSAVTRALDEPPTEAGLQLAATIPGSVRILPTKPLKLQPSHSLFARLDGGMLTAIEFYLAAAEALADDPPAVVVATGPSFNAFAAALFLAQRFGAKLVLDYRDEWSQNPFSFVQYGGFDRWWERRCLKAADAVLFTTRGQLQHTDAAFSGVIGEKGVILTNGWDGQRSYGEPEPRHDGKLEIAFSGLLGRMAMPGEFLADCSRVLAADSSLREKLRLRFIGRRHPEAEQELEKFDHPELLALMGQRPQAEADALIRQADALLIMPTPLMARYMPGKMFEYMATGKPILVHGHRGEVQELVMRLGAGIFIEEGDTDALAKAFASLAETPSSVWNNPRRQSWAQQHTRQRLAQRFFDLLTDLTATSNGINARS